MSEQHGACCRKLLSEGLDLCVRARKMDAQQRTNDMLEMHPEGLDMERFAARQNANWPDTPYMTRSATIPLWTQEQYDSDLADWERRSRQHLMQGCDE